MQGDSKKLQLVVQIGHVGKLTAEPIECLADDHVKGVGLQVG